MESKDECYQLYDQETEMQSNAMSNNLRNQDQNEIIFYNEIEQIWLAYERVVNKKYFSQDQVDLSRSKDANVEVLRELTRIMPKSLRQY